MTNPIIRIHNQEADEIIDREMTNEEVAQYQAMIDENAARVQEAAQKAQDRQAILEKLGLTQDELNKLLNITEAQTPNGLS